MSDKPVIVGCGVGYWDDAAEQFVLGAMMRDCAVIDTVVSVLGEAPSAFFTTSSRLIYMAIQRAYKKIGFADPSLVAAELEPSGYVGIAGGYLFIHGLEDRVLETESAECYARSVMETFLAREEQRLFDAREMQKGPPKKEYTDYHEYIKSDEWRDKAALAKWRAGQRCQVCNVTDRLEAHHRTYERLGHEEKGDITVLCRDCHQVFHDNRRLADQA